MTWSLPRESAAFLKTLREQADPAYCLMCRDVDLDRLADALGMVRLADGESDDERRARLHRALWNPSR